MSTRTDTIFPYTTLFRSAGPQLGAAAGRQGRRLARGLPLRVVRIPGRALRAQASWRAHRALEADPLLGDAGRMGAVRPEGGSGRNGQPGRRSEEHTSELRSLIRISYAVFCLKKKNK